MKNFGFSYLFLLFIAFSVEAQTELFTKQQDTFNTFSTLEKKLEYYNSLVENNANTYRALYDYLIAKELFDDKLYNRARDYYQKVIEGTSFKFHDSLNLHYELAYCQFAAQDYDEAVKNYGIVLENYSDDFIRNSCHLYLGYIYYYLGEYKLALSSVNQLSKSDPSINTKTLHLKRAVYASMGEYDKSEKTIEKIIRSSETKEDLALGYFGMGNLKLQMKDYNSARDFYLKSLKYSNSDLITIINNNLSSAYKFINLDSSLYYLQLNKTALRDRYQDQYNPRYAIYYQNMAEYYAFTNDAESSMSYIDSCIYNHCYQNAVKGNPSDYELDLFLLNDKLSLLEFLEVKLDIMERFQMNEIDDLFVLIDALIQGIRQEKYNDQSRFFQQQNLSRFYKKAYTHHKENEQLELAYMYLQKMKNVILLEKMQMRKAIDELPSSLRSFANDIQDSIETLLSNPNKTAKIDDEVNRQRVLYFNFINYVKKEYPQYHAKRYADFNVSVENIQSELNRNQVLLDYYIDSTGIDIFCISKKSFELNSVKNNSDFENLLVEYINWVSTKPKFVTFSDSLIDSKERLGEALYKLLIPIEVGDKSEYIIIPYDKLFYLPFESLIAEKEDYCKYVVCNNTVSYGFSGLLWYNSKIASSSKDINAFVLSPFENRDSYNYLPTASNESIFLKDNLNCKIHYTITKDEFIEYSKQSNIHHLITHAVIDSSSAMNSYLLLSDSTDMIEFSDIIHEDIPTELVCISACNSGNGALVMNEGVISLGRGYLESGAKSLVMSYHSIPDESSSKIFVDFYTYLINGFPKSVALSLSKSEYISSNTKYKSHPYFWAGLTLHGNEDALIYHKDKFKFWFIMSSFGIFIILLLLKKNYYN